MSATALAAVLRNQEATADENGDRALIDAWRARLVERTQPH
ncbi:MAG: hypothetical protein ACTHQ3_16005 [Motilibacteraceae bacterium]